MVASWFAPAQSRIASARHRISAASASQPPTPKAAPQTPTAAAPTATPSPTASASAKTGSTATKPVVKPTTTAKRTTPAPATPAAVTSADPGGLPAITAVAASAPHATSSNWAGWLVTGGSNTAVTASWVEPAASCAAGENSAAAFWVGLDGDGSSTVEQTGVSDECVNGQAQMVAWYEFYPSPAYDIRATVRAGDQLTATVTLSGGTVSLQLTDSSRGWTFSRQAAANGASGASAEVIAEAPSLASSGAQIPLSNFGQVIFTGVSIDNTPLAQVSSAFGLDMVAGGSTIATSSDRSGSAFAVSWHGSGVAGSSSSSSSGSSSPSPSASSSSSPSSSPSATPTPSSTPTP